MLSSCGALASAPPPLGGIRPGLQAGQLRHTPSIQHDTAPRPWRGTCIALHQLECNFAHAAFAVRALSTAAGTLPPLALGLLPARTNVRQFSVAKSSPVGRSLMGDNPDAADVTRWAKRTFIGLAILCWLIIAGISLWALAHFARALLLLLIAALVAYAVAPLVARLARYVPRWLAILVVYVALVAVIVGFGALVVGTAITQVSAAVQQAKILLAPSAGGGPSPLAQALGRFGISQAQITSFGQRLIGSATTVGAQVVPVLTGIANATLDAFLILVVSIYLVVDGTRVNRWLRTATPLRFRGRIASTVDTFQHVVGGYIRGQVTLAALIGVLVGLGMFIIPATRPFGILLGVIAFFFEFVPILGTIFSGVLCVALALPHGVIWGLVVLGYFVVMHVIEGDIVGPRIVGEAVGLHPVVSIIALIAGAELFGIWGALFASPVAGVIQAILVDLYVEWRRDHPDDTAGQDGHGAGGAAKAAAGAAAGALASSGAYPAQVRRLPDGVAPIHEQDNMTEADGDPAPK
jgi:predicted PurR-regulated permease PerM